MPNKYVADRKKPLRPKKKATTYKIHQAIKNRDVQEYEWEVIEFLWRKLEEPDLKFPYWKCWHAFNRDLTAILAGQMDTRQFADKELKEFFEKRVDELEKPIDSKVFVAAESDEDFEE